MVEINDSNKLIIPISTSTSIGIKDPLSLLYDATSTFG